MTKYADPTVQDAYLNQIKNNCVRMAICSAMPADYAGIAAVKLVEFTMSSSDFTLANGTTGRKVTVAAKSTPVNATATDSSGSTQHIVLHDNSSVMLFAQPPSNPQPITSGNPVTMGSWEINLPTPT